MMASVQPRWHNAAFNPLQSWQPSSARVARATRFRVHAVMHVSSHYGDCVHACTPEVNAHSTMTHMITT
jgi:hypothetical protein